MREIGGVVQILRARRDSGRLLNARAREVWLYARAALTIATMPARTAGRMNARACQAYDGPVIAASNST